MAIDYTAWPTPTQVYDVITSANVTPTLSSSSELVQPYIDSVVNYLTKKTHRQFLAGSAGEVRYFDGSGSGLQIIDEIVTLTAVEFLMYPQVAGINLVYYNVALTNGYPTTMLQIFQGPANTNFGYVTSFPPGRRNVKVTGTWGYASTIPPAVWMAVAKKAAGLILNTNTMDAQGQLKEWVDGDAKQVYDDGTISVQAGWDKEFEEVIKTFRRPLSEHHRRSRPELL